MRKLLLLLLVVPVMLIAEAQPLQQKLNAWSDKNPIEKVYLHTDREAWIAGEDLWFKAYFRSGFQPSSLSTSLYVELVNTDGTVLQSAVFPVYQGITQGQLELSKDMVTGYYFLRAWSPSMLNQPDFLFTKTIRIYGRQGITKEPVPKKTIQLHFFPEGGNLVTGLVNNIAFKANNENGLPDDVQMTIFNSKGQAIVQAKSYHDGMGLFPFMPLQGEKYYAVITNAEDHRYALPEPLEQGLSMRIRKSNGRVHFSIEHLGDNIALQPAFIIGQMQNRTAFRQDFDANRQTIYGQFPTAEFPSGILQLTVFNSNNIPLAERLVFINNREYVVAGHLETDTLHTGVKMLNQFTLILPDTVSGSFSVSVTDAAYEGPLLRAENIYAYFLLSSDIRGYVHRPSWYFQAASDSAEKAMDLLMLTNGWRRFKWSEIADPAIPKKTNKNGGFITLTGKATLRGSRKPYANQELLLMISPKGNTEKRMKYSDILLTDEQGNFSLDSLVFYDQSKLFFAGAEGKRNMAVSIKLDSDSLWRKFPLPPVAITMAFAGELSNSALASAYADYAWIAGSTLENVTITGRKKSPLEELDEYYTTGMFSGGLSARSIDLTKETALSMNIFDYLRERIPGITVVQQEAYHIFYRKPPSMQVIKPVGNEQVTPNALGNTTPNEMYLYVDEFPVQGDYLATIPVSDIAYVKVFSTFSGAPGGGGDGTLAVYLKKERDLQMNIGIGAEVIDYKGYSIIREFYSPDYSMPVQTADIADHRMTLLWVPDLFINDVNTRLPIRFYNNDRTKRFKVVVEGMTHDGKLLMLEQILE